MAPSQTRTCGFSASGSSGGRLARKHRPAQACSARTRYPLLFGGRIAMLCVISAFPINGSSFFRVPPLATPWLPSVSVRHVSIAPMKALRVDASRSRATHPSGCLSAVCLAAAAAARLSRPFASARFGGLRPLTAAASLGFARTTGRCSRCAPGRC